MYCSRCGKYNADDKIVCMYCGNRMQDIPTQQQNNQQQNNQQQYQSQNNKPSFYQSSAWQNNQAQQRQQPQQYYGEEKGGVGIALGFFFGLLGLIIGLLLYPSFTYERETFINGWIRGLIIGIVIGMVLAFAIICTGSCALGTYNR